MNVCRAGIGASVCEGVCVQVWVDVRTNDVCMCMMRAVMRMCV